MPELPEVETVVRSVRPGLVGRRATRTLHASPLMAVSDDGDFARRIAGRRFLRIDRHGKWIFCRLDGDLTLVVHLGMTGFLRIEPAQKKPVPHTHFRLLLDDSTSELRLSDPRRFGELLLLGPASWEARFGGGKLGPDALVATSKTLKESFNRTTRGLKTVLLDQRVIAGIGNIYADEILFDSMLHPGQRADRVGGEEIQRIVQSTRKILRQAIKLGGSTIRDYQSAEGTPGWFQWHHQAYGRTGEPCSRCQTLIVLRRDIASGRATHFCPKCQSKRLSGVSKSAPYRKISKAVRNA